MSPFVLTMRELLQKRGGRQREAFFRAEVAPFDACVWLGDPAYGENPAQWVLAVLNADEVRALRKWLDAAQRELTHSATKRRAKRNKKTQ